MARELRKTVSALMESYRGESALLKINAWDKIDDGVVCDMLENLRRLLFAGFFSRKRLREDTLEFYAGELLEDLRYNLEKQISRALRHRPGGEPSGADGEASRLTYSFLEKLPGIRGLLAADVAAAFDGDPAAFSTDEIILSYPGFYAITIHRLAHGLFLLDVPLIPRMMSERAHALTGIDIHPGASIGHHFFIDHGTGVVIGETALIGNFVKIYQGVTLGALSTRGGRSKLKSVKRHPTIEDNVTIYSGASILGGETVVGEGVVIGSNAFVTDSVPARARVSEGARQNRAEQGRGENWDYVI